MKMTQKGILLLLAALILFSGCDRFKKKAEAEPEKQVAVFAVNTIPAARGQIHDYIPLSGSIYSTTTVDAYSEAAGKIAEVYVSVGQRVNKGQRVASVDPSRPGMNYRNYTVSAPITGTVTSITAQAGMTVSQAVPLVKISGGSGLEIRLYVAERFISRIARNQTCVITTDAWPGETFYGATSELSPTIDQASRTMEVKLTVLDATGKLKPGMFAKVQVITEQKNNIVKVPSSAMISRFGEQYVYVVIQDPENSEFKIVQKRTVVPGIMIDQVLEITSGLEAGEEVVARGQTLLEDGVRVNVIEQMAPLSN
jgi:multidrug efflux pump subunit AcrA (membrane-fusion protein)